MTVFPPVLLGDLYPAFEILWELSDGVSIFWTLMLKFAATSDGGASLTAFIGILSLD